MTITVQPKLDYLYKNEGPFCHGDLEKLANARVAVGGLGAYGAGAVGLAQLGVGRGPRGLLRIADPDGYERHNANRQYEATVSQMTRNKTEVIAGHIRDLVPEVRLEAFTDGITMQNLDAFLDGVDIVVDGVDFLRPDVKLELHARARARGIPVAMVLLVNKGAVCYLFGRHSPSFEEFFAFPKDAELRESWVMPGSRIMPYYSEFPEEDGRPSQDAARRHIYDVLTGRHHISSNSLSGGAFNLLVNFVATSVLIGRPMPTVPKVMYLDPSTFTMGVASLDRVLEEHRASIWTRIAPVYDRVLSPQGGQTVYTEVVRRLAEDLGSCQTVLEAGVGTGMVAEQLALRGAEVHGIDLNLGMLAYALRRSVNLRKQGRRMFVGEGNVEDLFFADETFDGYCSNNVVFDADIDKALREAYRVLKPGGLLAINSFLAVPDLHKLGAHELVKLGAHEAHVREFLECQIEMYEGRALRHGFRTHGLDKVKSLILSIGFSDIVKTEKTYAGANFYLVARK